MDSHHSSWQQQMHADPMVAGLAEGTQESHLRAVRLPRFHACFWTVYSYGNAASRIRCSQTRRMGIAHRIQHRHWWAVPTLHDLARAALRFSGSHVEDGSGRTAHHSAHDAGLRTGSRTGRVDGTCFEILNRRRTEVSGVRRAVDVCVVHPYPTATSRMARHESRLLKSSFRENRPAAERFSPRRAKENPKTWPGLHEQKIRTRLREFLIHWCYVPYASLTKGNSSDQMSANGLSSMLTA